MSARRSTALVLRQWDFSETSQTVALFTRDAGLVRGLAKGARRDKAPYSGGFEALTLGEIVFLDRKPGELSTITEWDLQEVFRAPRRSFRAHLAGLYIADLPYHTVAIGDPHGRYFDRLIDALRALEDGDALERIVLETQWWTLDAIGSSPLLEGEGIPDAETVGFAPAQGRFVPDPGSEHGAEASSGIWRARRETLELLRSLQRDQHAPAEADGAVIRRASSLLAAFLRSILGRDLPTRAAFFDTQ